MATKIALHVQDINIDLSVIIWRFSTVFICSTLYNRSHIKRQVQLVKNGKIYVIFKIAANMATKVV